MDIKNLGSKETLKKELIGVQEAIDEVAYEMEAILAEMDFLKAKQAYLTKKYAIVERQAESTKCDTEN